MNHLSEPTKITGSTVTELLQKTVIHLMNCINQCVDAINHNNDEIEALKKEIKQLKQL